MEATDIDHILQIARQILEIIGLFAIVASGVPAPKKANAVIQVIRTLINMGAFNFWHAKNANQD